MLPAPSKRAASDAVLLGRTVRSVDVETTLVGDVGASGAFDVPLVVSHAGGLFDALLIDGLRRGLAVGVVSRGFNGELVGVEGRSVDGERSIELGRRNGDVRGLLKDSGDGL